MHINSDALQCVWSLCSKRQADILFSSLQVFDLEDHASLHSDKSKEGLSIYGEFVPPVGVSAV